MVMRENIKQAMASVMFYIYINSEEEQHENMEFLDRY